MMILTHNYLQQHKMWRFWLYKLLPLTIVFVLIFRLCMVIDILPVGAFIERFHAWKKWPQQLKKNTRHLPVVFKNSYQRASQYWFHTGQPAYSLNDYRERMNNYNFWPVGDSLLGRTVYVMDIYHLDSFTDSIQARIWKVGFTADSSFHSFARVWIECERFNSAFHESDSLVLHLRVNMPEYYKNYLSRHSEIDEPIIVSFFKGKEWLKDVNPGCTLQALARNLQQIIIFPYLEKGKYYLLFAVKSSTDLFTCNSEKIGISIK